MLYLDFVRVIDITETAQSSRCFRHILLLLVGKAKETLVEFSKAIDKDAGPDDSQAQESLDVSEYVLCTRFPPKLLTENKKSTRSIRRPRFAVVILSYQGRGQNYLSVESRDCFRRIVGRVSKFQLT